VEETLKEAEEYGQRGFTVLKVKLGKDLTEDIERIVKLREKLVINSLSVSMPTRVTPLNKPLSSITRPNISISN